MQITILGSGTAVPLTDRGSPSVALSIEGKTLLFDMGPGTMRQLARIGKSVEQIDHIFLTHFHPDHSADLIHFLFACRNPEIMKKRNPFSISGPVGLVKFIDRLQCAYPRWLNLPSGIMQTDEFSSTGNTRRDYGLFYLISAPTLHTNNSLAFRIESRSGKALVISGDTGFSKEVIDLANGADLLILEAAVPDGNEVEGHLTPSQAGRVASLSGVKHLLLTHFYPETLKTDIAGQCRKTWSGELTLGSDLLQLRI